MKPIKTILVSSILVALTSCGGNHSSQFISLETREISAPLGEFVKFADDKIYYTLGEPDTDGDVMLTLECKFDILKHASNIDFMRIEADIDNQNNKYVYSFYFKKDQEAVAALAKAIKDDKTKHVTVEWKQVISAETANKFKNETLHLVNDEDYSSAIYFLIKDTEIIGLQDVIATPTESFFNVYSDYMKSNIEFRTNAELQKSYRIDVDLYADGIRVAQIGNAGLGIISHSGEYDIHERCDVKNLIDKELSVKVYFSERN